MDDIERIAQRLGMKPSEVIEVKETADGVLAQTHDGQWTLIRDDGELVFRADPPVDSDDAADPAEESTEAASPAKRAVPKRRASR